MTTWFLLGKSLFLHNILLMCKEKSIFWQFSGASVNKTQLQREICVRVWASGGRSPLLNMVFWGATREIWAKGFKTFPFVLRNCCVTKN